MTEEVDLSDLGILTSAFVEEHYLFDSARPFAQHGELELELEPELALAIARAELASSVADIAGDSASEDY